MSSSALGARLAGFCAIFAAVALDQWSKAAIIAATAAGDIPATVFPFFNLALVWNRGISFGMLGHMQAWVPLLLIAGTSLLALALFVWLTRAQDAPTAIALGLVVGGAAGNIFDRLRYGAVADFLDFHAGAIHFWTFNVADSAIFIGVVILTLIGIVRPSTERKDEEP